MSQNISHNTLNSNPDNPAIKAGGQSMWVRLIIPKYILSYGVHTSILQFAHIIIIAKFRFKLTQILYNYAGSKNWP
jgi:hypothetical protein